jgi:hypothetical protein
MPFLAPSRTPLRTLLGIALATLALAAPASAEPRLSRVSGTVEIGRGEPPAWQAASVGDVVGAGDRVRTGRDGRAEVDLGRGTVRLYEHSLLRLPPDALRLDGAAATELQRGGALFDVAPRNPRDPFEVRTPEVVASVKGTRFGVDAREGRAAVSVYSGLVGVRGLVAPPESEVMVRAGFLAAGSRDVRPELELLRNDDPWDGWSGGSAPPAPQALPGPAARDDSASAPPGAVEDARDAARRAAAPEVLEAVAQRDPEVARARDAAMSEKADGSAAASIDENLADDVLSGGADAAREVNAPTETRTPLDRVTAETGDETKTVLEERVAESLLNGTAPSTDPAAGGGTLGALTNLGLTYEIEKSGGSNLVEISTATGTLVTLDKTQLETIATTGDTSTLSPALLSVLQSNGVSPITFAQQLLRIAY